MITPIAALDLLVAVTSEWVDDPDSDVVWAGSHEGRWGIRMAQQVRDFTTVWFDVGDRTLSAEGYLLPPPRHNAAEVYRLCLARNWSSWPVGIAIDRQGELYVRGRMPLDSVSRESIDQLVGAIYELVELSFRTLVDAGFRQRENSP